jgi:hypothetical protein
MHPRCSTKCSSALCGGVVQHRSQVLTGGGWGSPGGKTSTRGSPTAPERFLEAETSALGMGAQRTGAAARGATDLRPSRGSTLGCVVYQHAGARIPTDAHTEQRHGNQRRGPRRRGGVNDTCTQTKHADQFAGETHGDGEHKDMEGPGATSRRGRPQAHKAILRPSPERAMVRGHSRACARAASPCPLGAAIW